MQRSARDGRSGCAGCGMVGETRLGHAVGDVLEVPCHARRTLFHGPHAVDRLHEIAEMKGPPVHGDAVTPRQPADPGRCDVGPGADDIEPEAGALPFLDRLFPGRAFEKPVERDNGAAMLARHHLPAILEGAHPEGDGTPRYGLNPCLDRDRPPDTGGPGVVDGNPDAHGGLAILEAMMNEFAAHAFCPENQGDGCHRIDTGIADRRRSIPVAGAKDAGSRDSLVQGTHLSDGQQSGNSRAIISSPGSRVISRNGGDVGPGRLANRASSPIQRTEIALRGATRELLTGAP